MSDATRQTVERHLGALLVLCRTGRGADGARRLAATTIAAYVETAPVSIEVQVVHGSALPGGEDHSIPARLIARGFEAVTLAPGVSADEVLALAESLASDTAPVRESAYIGLLPLTVALEPPPPPVSVAASAVVVAAPAGPVRMLPDRRAWEERRRPLQRRYEGVNRRRQRDRRESGERRLPNQQQQRVVIERFASQFTESSDAGHWVEALHAAAALAGIEPQVPIARRGMHRIAVRRMLAPAVLHKFAAIGLTREDERERVARLFRWMGLDGADVLLPLILEHERAAPRRFLHELLAAIPDAHTIVAPILQSERPHEVRHAVELLGLMRPANTVAKLRPLLDHPSDAVRLATVLALGEFPTAESAVRLGAALATDEEPLREAAVAVIARRRIGTLAMPLMAALGREKRREGRLAIIRALGQLPSSDAAMALARIALTRPRFFGGGGYPLEERLEAVTALRGSEAPNAGATLERVLRDGDAKVRAAVSQAIAARRAASAGSGSAAAG